MSRSIAEMRNLGPKMARLLAEIGVRTDEELRALGAVEAYARLRMVSRGGLSLNALYAMHAALSDTDWRTLAASTKAELRRAVGGAS